MKPLITPFFSAVLTGTPVQNNLHEFGALLSFLAPNVFTDLSLFDAAFNLRVTKKHHNKNSSDEEAAGTFHV